MRGFTLIEILVSVILISLVMAGIFYVFKISNTAYFTNMGLLDLQQQARQAMHTIIRELRQSKSSVIIVEDNKITFKIPDEEYSSPWIGPIVYYRDVDDTNGDGITNQIIREYPLGTRKVLANDIITLEFLLSGNIVEIGLAAKKAVHGREICFPVPCEEPAKTLREKVKLRNE